ncbi:radiation sensitive protein rad9 [Saitoella coloradoensis]
MVTNGRAVEDSLDASVINRFQAGLLGNSFVRAEPDQTSASISQRDTQVIDGSYHDDTLPTRSNVSGEGNPDQQISLNLEFSQSQLEHTQTQRTQTVISRRRTTLNSEDGLLPDDQDESQLREVDFDCSRRFAPQAALTSLGIQRNPLSPFIAPSPITKGPPKLCSSPSGLTQFFQSSQDSPDLPNGRVSTYIPIHESQQRRSRTQATPKAKDKELPEPDSFMDDTPVRKREMSEVELRKMFEALRAPKPVARLDEPTTDPVELEVEGSGAGVDGDTMDSSAPSLRFSIQVPETVKKPSLRKQASFKSTTDDENTIMSASIDDPTMIRTDDPTQVPVNLSPTTPALHARGMLQGITPFTVDKVVEQTPFLDDTPSLLRGASGGRACFMDTPVPPPKHRALAPAASSPSDGKDKGRSQSRTPSPARTKKDSMTVTAHRAADLSFDVPEPPPLVGDDDGDESSSLSEAEDMSSEEDRSDEDDDEVQTEEEEEEEEGEEATPVPATMRKRTNVVVSQMSQDEPLLPRSTLKRGEDRSSREAVTPTPPGMVEEEEASPVALVVSGQATSPVQLRSSPVTAGTKRKRQHHQSNTLEVPSSVMDGSLQNSHTRPTPQPVHPQLPLAGTPSPPVRSGKRQRTMSRIIMSSQPESPNEPAPRRTAPKTLARLEEEEEVSRVHDIASAVQEIVDNRQTSPSQSESSRGWRARDRSTSVTSTQTAPKTDVRPQSQDYSTRVFALFRGTPRNYYTGTVILDHQVECKPNHVWIRFDDENDVTGTGPLIAVEQHQVKPLDLHIGDVVRLDIEVHGKSFFTVVGLKRAETLTARRTDVSGNNIVTVRLHEKEKPFDVPIERVILTSKLFKQFRNRTLSTPTVMSPYSTASTPPRRLPSTGHHHPRGLSPMVQRFTTQVSTLFRGCVFALTFSGGDAARDEVTRDIRLHGARILEIGLDELYHPLSDDNPNAALVPRNDVQGHKFACVIADRYSRKIKYLQALALGLPCLSFRFVKDCIRAGEIVDWQTYLLPAGASDYLHGACRSMQVVPFIDGINLFERLTKKHGLLDDKSVLIVTGKGRTQETRKVYEFLTYAMGAAKVDKAPDPETVGAHLRRKAAKGWDYIIVGKEGEASKIKNMAGLGHEKGGMRVVEVEWLVQSLILGRLI